MLNIKIDTKNSAFEDNLEGEIRYCLMKIIVKLNSGEKEGNLLDSNGNNVGSFKLTNK